MNAVGFAARGPPASGSCVLLSINQTASTQAALGPAVRLVGNAAHSSLRGRVPLNTDTCCGIPTDAPLPAAESRDGARRRSASGHTIHRNTGTARTVNIASLLLGQDIKHRAKSPNPFQLGSRREPSRFIHHLRMKLQRLKRLKRPQSLRCLDSFSQNKSAISKTL